MFDDLKKYEQQGHFFFKYQDQLKDVCNAPTDKSGIYIVYALNNVKIELIYIGRSGKLGSDSAIFIRKAGLGGIKDRIVNGHQFGKIPRRISWINQMRKEGIEVIDIYWCATHNEEYSDCPRVLENKLLQNYINIYGRLPKWNKAL